MILIDALLFKDLDPVFFSGSGWLKSPGSSVSGYVTLKIVEQNKNGNNKIGFRKTDFLSYQICLFFFYFINFFFYLNPK